MQYTDTRTEAKGMVWEINDVRCSTSRANIQGRCWISGGAEDAEREKTGRISCFVHTGCGPDVPGGMFYTSAGSDGWSMSRILCVYSVHPSFKTQQEGFAKGKLGS